MQILCDTHTHTLYSRHAYSTIEENVRAAAEQGLELLSSTDHFSPMIFPAYNGLPEIRDFQYFMNYTSWPRTWHGITLLHGCEACIVDLEGKLFGWNVDIPGNDGWGDHGMVNLQDEVFADCDYVIASIHDKKFCEGASLSTTTQMYINALEHPKVLAIGHIGRAGVPFDMDEVLLAAKSMNKLIELNEHSLEYERHQNICRRIALRCAELGVKVSIASDAHISSDIGHFEHVSNMLDEIHFPEELLTCNSAETFLGALEQALPYNTL